MKIPSLLITIILLITILFNQKIRCDEIIMENNNLQVIFNKQNGALEQLKSKSGNWRIERRPSLSGSFYMNIPLSGQRFNPASGSNQKKVEYVFDEKNKKVTFIWDQIISEKGGKLDIVFKGTAQLKDDGLTFTGKLTTPFPFSATDQRVKGMS